MAVTREQVAELYVAFFDRAPDAAGLAYWVDESGFEIEEISQSFFDQEETKTKYPDSLTDAVFVDTIYQNVFNRASDPDGLDYWVKELESGNISRADMILAVVNGAQDTTLGNDQMTLDNKTEVGLYFVTKGLENVDDAAAVMSGVNDTEASVIAAKDDINSLNPLVLTANKDTLVGTNGDDTITGTNLTYTVGDTIDGKDGHDTFNLNISAAFTDKLVQVSNVEDINVTSGGVATTISAANWTGVENITILKSADLTNNINDLGVELKSFVISNAIAGNKTNVTTSQLTGSNDTFHVAVDKAIATTTIALKVSDQATTPKGVVENYDIETKTTVATTTVNEHAADDFSGTQISTDAIDTGLKTVKVHGDGGIEYVADQLSASLSTIDASGLNGSFKYDGATIGANVSQTIIGGNKNDILLGGTASDTFIGGKGSDSITVGSGGDLVKILYKEDSGTTTATADKIISFSHGTDQIDIVGLDAGSASNFITNSTTFTAATTVEKAVAEANKGEIAGKQYVAYTDTANTFLTYDIDHDGVVDGAIEIVGQTNLSASDII